MKLSEVCDSIEERRKRLLKRRVPKRLRSGNPFKNRSSHTDRVRGNRRKK